MGEDPSNGMTIGMVGYPNVGKSSTINALLMEKKVGHIPCQSLAVTCGDLPMLKFRLLHEVTCRIPTVGGCGIKAREDQTLPDSSNGGRQNIM